MYQTCMFCKKPLGTNEVVEEFPVGRRLAFDSAKGRLWVVCRKCQRWNLAPIEERWEAVETCERLFRGTRIRTSSENIGLASHREGLELVRIGKPLRPEFAAWRYGGQFRTRYRRAALAPFVGFGISIAINSAAAGYPHRTGGNSSGWDLRLESGASGCQGPCRWPCVRGSSGGTRGCRHLQGERPSFDQAAPR